VSAQLILSAFTTMLDPAMLNMVLRSEMPFGFDALG
jgi:hypothetical protein